MTTYTDLKTFSGSTNFIYSILTPFQVADIGSWITICAGTGFIPGDYLIRGILTGFNVGIDGNQNIAFVEYDAGMVGATAGQASTATTYNIIVFDGDSLTAGTDVGIPHYWWWDVLYNLGPLWRGYNTGVPGQGLGAMITAAPTSVDTKFGDLISGSQLGRQIVVAWGGTNDLASGITPATTLQLYQQYCAARKLIGWETWVMPIIDRTNPTLIGGFEIQRQIFNLSLISTFTQFADGLVPLQTETRLYSPNASSNPSFFYQGGPDPDRRVHISGGGSNLLQGLVTTALLQTGLTSLVSIPGGTVMRNARFRR